MSKETKQLEKLMSELFDGKFSPKITEDKLKSIKSQPNIYFFPSVRDGKIIAIATLYVMELFTRKVAIIEEVCTLKKYRNQGIGSRIVKDAISMANFLGCDCLELTVKDEKTGVQKFYKDLGFKDRKNMSMRLMLK